MLSQSGIHAIRAMVTLATLPESEYRGVAEIARETGSPRNYLGKLLLQLSRHGLVESRKGLGGGFRLSKPAREIRLYDVMGGIEDINRWTECAFSNRACSDTNPCIVHGRWGHAREAFLTFLRDTTIAELAQNHSSEITTAAGASLAAALKHSS